MEANGHFLEVELDKIHPSPFQGRAAIDEGIGSLSKSIKEQGLLQPVMVTEISMGDYAGEYELVFGERRLLAAREAGEETILVRVVTMDPAEQFKCQIAENYDRVELTPIERARSYRRALDILQISPEELAALLGKSASYVCETLSLRSLPQEIQDAMLTGSAAEPGQSEDSAYPERRLPYSVAAELARLGDGHSEEQSDLYQKWLKHRLDRAEVRRLARLVTSGMLARAPERLRVLALTDANITADIAELLAAPHEAEDLPEDMRQAAQQIPSEQIDRIAGAVVERGLDKAQTLELLLEYLHPGPDEPTDLDSLLRTVRLAHQALRMEMKGGLVLLRDDEGFEQLIQVLQELHEMSGRLIEEGKAEEGPLLSQCPGVRNTQGPIDKEEGG